MAVQTLDYRRVWLALQLSLEELSSGNGDLLQSDILRRGNPQRTLTLGLYSLTKQVIRGSRNSSKYVNLSHFEASTFVRLMRHWSELATVICTVSPSYLEPTRVDLLIQVKPKLD